MKFRAAEGAAVAPASASDCCGASEGTGAGAGTSLPVPVLPFATSVSVLKCNLPPYFLRGLFGHATALRSLRLDATLDVSVDVTRAITASCGQLELVSLSGCRFLTDDAVSALRLPHLVALDLSSCVLLTGAGVTAVTAHSPHLRALHMRGVEVQDATLATVAAHCPGLTSLALGSNNPFGGGRGGDFTAAGLAAVLAACPGLVSLTAAGSGDGLADEALAAALARHPQPALTTLDLSGNNRVGDSTARVLADAAPALTTLRFFRGAVSDAGLLSAMYLPSLAELDLGSCSAVTPAGLLHALRRAPPALLRVRLGGMRALRDRALVPAVRELLPPLAVLEL